LSITGLQIGEEKTVLILGLRLSCLPAVGQPLRHEEVEPITLEPVKESTGEVVYHQLKEVAKRTGVPREILSDHGPDLSKGIELSCQGHPQTCAVYDIKHKTAALLKRELDQEPKWKGFIGQASQTKVSLQQTALAWLAPPNQRSKAGSIGAKRFWSRAKARLKSRIESPLEAIAKSCSRKWDGSGSTEKN
jgi:hypothetical protein